MRASGRSGSITAFASSTLCQFPGIFLDKLLYIVRIDNINEAEIEDG